MNRIYDNGALMLGDVNMVISEVEKEIKEDLDMCFTDKKDLLKDLKELRGIDNNMIVCVNYENPMGYDITYWDKNDRIERGDEI